MRNRLVPRRYHQGISLIEILVSILIIAVGLLGMASLQMSSLRGNQGSYQRSQANLFAQDLIERIRANPARANPAGWVPVDENDNYLNLYWAYTSGSTDCEDIPDPYCADNVTGDAETCDPFQLAAFDLFSTYCGVRYGDGTKTRQGIQDTLHQGALVVDCNDPDLLDLVCDEGSTHTVTISWTERDADSSAGFKAHNVSVSF